MQKDTHAHTHTHTRTHTHTHAHTHTHTHTHAHTRTHTHTHAHTRTHTHTQARTHTFTHRHKGTHTRTHTHTSPTPQTSKPTRAHPTSSHKPLITETFGPWTLYEVRCSTRYSERPTPIEPSSFPSRPGSTPDPRDTTLYCAAGWIQGWWLNREEGAGRGRGRGRGRSRGAQPLPLLHSPQSPPPLNTPFARPKQCCFPAQSYGPTLTQ